MTGVGDLDDVGSDFTNDNVAKVQDVLGQVDSETVNTLLWRVGRGRAQRWSK